MKKPILFLILVICIILLLQNVEAKKKKKKNYDKRPSDVQPELYCNACQAMVRETLKKIRSSRKEYDIADALSDICSDRNYSIYEFPPPDMRKGCEAFMGGWTETVETALLRRANNEDIEDEICIKKTKACQGVDPKNRDSKPKTVNINGKDVPIGPDGKVAMENEDL